MRFYAYYDAATGRVMSCVNQLGDATPPDGQLAIELDAPLQNPASHVLGGVITDLPPRPSNLHEWTATGWQLINGALATAKTSKNAEINAARLSANQSYFEFAGKQITADPLSRGDIDAVNGYVSLTGQMPPNWIGAWKTADNSWIPVADVATWTAFYSAMLNQGSVNFAKAQTLKAAVVAAQSIAEVEAITWD